MSERDSGCARDLYEISRSTSQYSYTVHIILVKGAIIRQASSV